MHPPTPSIAKHLWTRPSYCMVPLSFLTSTPSFPTPAPSFPTPAPCKNACSSSSVHVGRSSGSNCQHKRTNSQPAGPNCAGGSGMSRCDPTWKSAAIACSECQPCEMSAQRNTLAIVNTTVWAHLYVYPCNQTELHSLCFCGGGICILVRGTPLQMRRFDCMFILVHRKNRWVISVAWRAPSCWFSLYTVPFGKSITQIFTVSNIRSDPYHIGGGLSKKYA